MVQKLLLIYKILTTPIVFIVVILFFITVHFLSFIINICGWKLNIKPLNIKE